MRITFDTQEIKWRLIEKYRDIAYIPTYYKNKINCYLDKHDPHGDYCFYCYKELI